MYVGIRNIIVSKKTHSDSSLSISDGDKTCRGGFSFPTKLMEESVQDNFLSFGNLQSNLYTWKVLHDELNAFEELKLSYQLIIPWDLGVLAPNDDLPPFDIVSSISNIELGTWDSIVGTCFEGFIYEFYSTIFIFGMIHIQSSDMYLTSIFSFLDGFRDTFSTFGNLSSAYFEFGHGMLNEFQNLISVFSSDLRQQYKRELRRIYPLILKKERSFDFLKGIYDLMHDIEDVGMIIVCLFCSTYFNNTFTYTNGLVTFIITQQ